MVEEFEVWHNTGEGRVIIRRMNELGGYHHESVRGGGDVHLSPQERRYNQSLSAPGQDPFSNSILVRVDDAAPIPEPDDDTVALDRLTDERIDELLDAHWKTLAKTLAEIDSAVAIRRILTRAEEAGVSTKRLDMLRGRLREVAPGAPLANKARRAVTVDSDIAAPQQVDIYNMGPESKTDFVAGGLT